MSIGFVEQAIVDNLQARLTLAKVDIAGLVAALKLAYDAQLSPRSAVALTLLNEIRRHEPRWEPKPRIELVPWPTNGEMGTTRLKKERKR